MSQSCQNKVQLCFSGCFGKWADIVSDRTCIVFIAAIAVFFGLAVGMSQSSAYEDEQFVWTPADNESIQNYEKASDLFDTDEKQRVISIIAESKSDNLFTIESFKEMIDYQKMMFSIEEFRKTTLNEDTREAERPSSGEKVTFNDICRMIPYATKDADGKPIIVNKCLNTPQPIDFIYDLETDSYPIENYSTEEALLDKVKLGKTEPPIKPLIISNFVAETVPEEIEQNLETGIITEFSKGKAAAWSYLIQNGRNEDIDESMYEVWEKELMDKTEEWNAKSKHLTINLFTIYGVRLAFSEDIQADLATLSIAIILVAVYTILALGTFSTMHCRLVVSLIGLLCVGISYAAGFGLMFLMGGQTAGVHNLMPFLLIGIGVDDMFVICNAVDQTRLKDTPRERIREAMMHAGPSITITSLTNALAFAFGGLNSLTALRSFCLFASVCILMLYLVVMTIFLSVVVWDTERVGRKKGECCGLCCCKQDSILCCGGFFLSPKMIAYGTLPDQDNQLSEKKKEEESQLDNSLQNTMTERCLEKYLAPYVLSNVGRIILLVVYLILIAVAAYGCTQVKIDFKVTYFIGETAFVYEWYQLNDKYFNQGSLTTTYVDNPSLDLASEQTQKDILTFNEKLQECEGCDEKWNMPNTLSMWYDSFHKYSYYGGCKAIAGANTKPGTLQEYIVPSDTYYDELKNFFQENCGKDFVKNLVYEGDIKTVDFRIKAWRQTIQVKKIEEIAKQGVQYLKDLRAIEDKYALPGTYSYSQEMLDYELYFVFVDETLLSCGLSIVAVFFVVLFVTGSLPITCLVVLAILLVDLFLVAMIHYWNLTFNNVVVVNLVIAIGLAVDYSAHIAHTYLTINAPKDLEKGEQRRYKARKAISGMGSSVFHGAFSTFLAIVALGGARSYIFVVFFRLWLGIIVFGMANGFLLVPVILSLIGPLGVQTDHSQGKSVNKIEESSQKSIKDDVEMAKNKNAMSPEDHQTNKVV